MDTVKKDESWRNEPMMVDLFGDTAPPDKEARIAALGVLFAPRFTEQQDSDIRARVSWVGHKHGVLLGVTKAEFPVIADWITYHYGAKAYWTKKMPSGTYGVEFVYQGDGRVSKPWLWDGKTVLFQDWQADEQANGEEARKWRIGNLVRFYFRGNKRYPAGWYSGVISARNKMASVTCPGINAQWHVRYDELESVEV